ncbi:hypothetical protein XU18_0899 [Perkinsela sp. CCAP 1560/4]|nr:hypothetical protein XU18_0899 [Perkinsela sp. CCAP 1560/4]|eukprot:KNH08613.1 hypothetical protein XU18_0899 [Perkinsela sp. CCAP 1560/4]
MQAHDAKDATNDRHTSSKKRRIELKTTISRTGSMNAANDVLKKIPLSLKSKVCLLHRVASGISAQSLQLLDYLSLIEQTLEEHQGHITNRCPMPPLKVDDPVTAFLYKTNSSFHGEKSSETALLRAVEETLNELKETFHENSNQKTDDLHTLQQGEVEKSQCCESQVFQPKSIAEVQEAVVKVIRSNAERASRRQRMVETNLSRQNAERRKEEENIRKDHERQRMQKRKELSSAVLPDVNLLDDADWAG